jgi:hypothetical protein
MKRMFTLVTLLFLVGSLFAEEAVLIDFSRLVADISVNNQDGILNQNRQTMMDYSNVAGGSFTQEQKDVMKTSLAVANWEILLASSSRNVTNQVLSFAKEAPSRQYGSVLGVRVHFPVENWNSWAMIKPPFEIPAFEPPANVNDDGSIEASEDSNGITGPSRFEDGFGVVKNVGTLKSVAVSVYGLNFPHSISAILIDSQGKEKIIHLGYVNFDGWGELRWDNPAYVTEVRNRELRLYPLYPASTPFVKFGGFLVQRDAAREGGDFIVYFKDVKIIYDKAVLDTERDIDDEGLWQIIQDRETKKKVFEMERFGHNQVLRYLEEQKKATENSFTPSPTTDAGQTE